MTSASAFPKDRLITISSQQQQQQRVAIAIDLRL
eukprot:COSAG06_NODE_40783_length_398_cov_1.545151_2_plen_33_part_01